MASFTKREWWWPVPSVQGEREEGFVPVQDAGEMTENGMGPSGVKGLLKET